MHYIPYDELGDRPNVIVDGAANAHTLVTLSHWPESPTPDILRDDLSAQIVFRYLDRPELWVPAEIVSNNHFDEDGLISVYTLTNPSEAQRHRELLIDIAAAGDFGTYRFREAARAAFVLSAFADPELSPLDAGIFREHYPRLAARLYQELLPRLSDIVNHVDRFRSYWEPEDALLNESEASIRSGDIQIEEIPALDLAVVVLPEHLRNHRVHRFTQNRRAACHPMALHNVLNSFRVVLMQGRTYELQYRYESWVRYISRPLLTRSDLAPLAEQLSALESGNGRWVFDGVDEITPKLALVDAEESRLAPQEFLQRIKEYLARVVLSGAADPGAAGHAPSAPDGPA
jgi:hypothetical protein